MLVAAATAATAAYRQAFTRLGQVAQFVATLDIVDQSAGGDCNHQVRSRLAGEVVGPSIAAVLRRISADVTERLKGIEGGPDLENDVAAAASIPTVRPAARDELLAVEVDHPIAALTGANNYLCFIDEHRLRVCDQME